jgi:hypothetical protein
MINTKNVNNDNDNKNDDILKMILEYMKKQDKQNESALAVQTDLSNSVKLTNERLFADESKIKDIYKRLDEYFTGFSTLKDEFELHKDNEVIDENQRKAIHSRTFTRIKEFLSDDYDYARYHMTYFGDLYKYLKQFCHYTTMSSTVKKHFDDVMGGIESWYPHERELKSKADDMAKARMMARNNGYKC